MADEPEPGRRQPSLSPGADHGPAATPARERRLVDGGLIFVTALLCLSGAGVWITRGPERFFDLLWSDLGLALILLPKIFGGILLATALGLSLPRARVVALIGPDSGWRGLMIAAVAGAVLPGGPHVIYPLTLALIAAGADLAAGVTIVSAWVLLSLNRTVVWELSFIPVEFVAMRFLLTLPVPVLLGLVVRVLAARAATR